MTLRVLLTALIRHRFAFLCLGHPAATHPVHYGKLLRRTAPQCKQSTSQVQHLRDSCFSLIIISLTPIPSLSIYLYLRADYERRHA